MVLEETSGIIQPPPLDPLDGLEVIIGGSFTMGKLRMIPSRRFRRGKSMLDSNLLVEDLVDEDTRPSSSSSSSTTTSVPSQVSEEEERQRAIEDAVKAQAEADAAAAEGKRKADKMEMLKKRAEEAMARKKAAKEKKE
jgi:hypothetical protein